MKASGRNTVTSTSVMPTMAPLICGMAFLVASFGDRPSLAMIRSTFSTTTMASSTRIPMASTMANMVSTLIEKPSASITTNAPSMATGTTRAGIRV
ncbi:Uncharacterised protein [Bordetella pertussis]|nr:Uncharacterised protein [Bordetella pertussis]CFN49771.1 Uncharacterised protein [Bordetella pertussis]CFO00484.1 Uncharacterised protein [Bordetella pertussis]CFO34877.1 Uncharacterised protein [Bordetella pertussis]CFO65339.1 Uncharacterised protein [Bordetella pertussis]